MRPSVFRVRWTRPHWISQKSPSSRLYSQRAAAVRVADRLRSSGAVVTIDHAGRDTWSPFDDGGAA